MFLPGWFLLLAVFGRSEKYISQLERFIFSFGLGIIITDFIAFFYSKFNIPITKISSVLGVIVFSSACYVIYIIRIKGNSIENCHPERSEGSRNLITRFLAKLGMTADEKDNDLFSFTKNQFVLILILLFLTIFIKTAYLTSTVAPTSTDMGHHMYWVNEMVQTHQLPTYENMPDFIIGEHVVLAELAMINNLSLFSALPVLFLLLINILGILTVFVLTLRIFKNQNVALLSLLFLGVLYAVSSPQAKFVSGGVMGNILGNFLMPMTLYLYFRAGEFISKTVIASEAKQSSSNNLEIAASPSAPRNDNAKRFLSLGIFVTFGLFYTHHLTAFIFLFVFAFLVLAYLAINYKDFKTILQKSSKLIFSRSVMLTFITGFIFFFFIFTPNYFKTSAVETAVGAPSKATREGLSLTSLKDSVGEARMALGIIGLMLLALAYKRKNFGYAVILAWAVMLFIMSSAPEIIFINLPSSRIGNYTSYPLAILGAFGLYGIFNPQFLSFIKNKNAVPFKFISSVFILIIVFVMVSGLHDSATAFKKASDFTPTLETFSASDYLAQNTELSDVVLKDHNYMTGDTWMKLFFMRGYTYPLSRSYFKRYEDPTNPREMCTLYMISNPGGSEAKDCFIETDTKYIMVNPKYDSLQFSKLKNFDEIYNSGNVAVYKRK